MKEVSTRSRAIACSAVIPALLVGAAACAAGPPQDRLEPEWIWRVRPGVEWAELTDCDGFCTVLVATTDGRLHVIDAKTGAARLSEPVAAGRGVRVAQGAKRHDSVAYCYHRGAAMAIRLSEPVRLKWRFGAKPDHVDSFQGDPEVLAGWDAARVADAGLLVVGSDGRVVLLSHDSGGVLWQRELGPLPLSRVHVWGNTAAVLWKTTGQVRVAFADLAAERPSWRERELGELWPVWSTLIGEGLVTVSSSGVVIWPAAGAPHQLNVRLPESRASAIDVCTRPGVANHESALLLAGTGASIVAYDLSRGGEAWLWRDTHEWLPNVGYLTVRGEHVLAASDKAVGAWRTATGRLAGRCLAVGRERLIAGELVGGCLWGLFGQIVDREAPGRLVGMDVAEALSSRPADRCAEPGSYRVQATEEIRQVLWSTRHMILVEAGGLRAYTLPPGVTAGP